MSPASTTGRSYKSSDERRGEIVSATLAILAERGMHAWTTSSLADRVGVSEATIFKHFESKDAILTAALRHQAGELRARIEEYEGEGSGWERAEGLIHHVLSYLERTQGGPLVILLGQASRIQPEMKDEVGRTRQLFRSRLREMAADALEESGRGGELDPGAVADLAHAAGMAAALRWTISGNQGELLDVASPMLGVLRHCLGEGRPPGAAPDEMAPDGGGA